MKAAADAMPTLEQVEEEVLSAEAEMAKAKARKDYRRAAELSLKLPAMHDRHSALASAIRKAMNRKQLAEEVRRLEGEVRDKMGFISSLKVLLNVLLLYYMWEGDCGRSVHIRGTSAKM